METDIEGPGLPGSAEPCLLCAAATILKGKSAIEGQIILEGKPANNEKISVNNPNSYITATFKIKCTL